MVKHVFPVNRLCLETSKCSYNLMPQEMVTPVSNWGRFLSLKYSFSNFVFMRYAWLRRCYNALNSRLFLYEAFFLDINIKNCRQQNMQNYPTFLAWIHACRQLESRLEHFESYSSFSYCTHSSVYQVFWPSGGVVDWFILILLDPRLLGQNSMPTVWKVWITLGSLHIIFRTFLPELWPLIYVKISFPLIILRTNRQNFAKFYVCLHIDKV